MVFVEENRYKKEIGIYKITNLKNGKVYIGQTKERFQRRYWFHRWVLNSNKHSNSHLQRSWNKHGAESFEFSVVEVLKKEQINEREIYWISFYREDGICYNIQDGGQFTDLHRYMTPEMRRHIGRLNRERLLGSRLSEETKLKMSKARRGRYVKRTTDILDVGRAREIKKRLIKGESPSSIGEDPVLGVGYKVVNNIYSSNHWSHVHVEGWDKFYKSIRRKQKKSGKELEEFVKEIYILYDKLGTYVAVAKKMGIDRSLVRYHILKRK